MSKFVKVPDPPPPGISPPWYTPEILVRVVTFLHHKCQQSQESAPRTWDPRECCDFEAMQVRGVSKVATLTWMGHGFGLRRAQLLTLDSKPFHTYTPKH